MGILLNGVTGTFQAVDTSIKVLSERESSGNIRAFRLLDGISRIFAAIIGQMGDSAWPAMQAVVALNKFLKPASAAYGAFSSTIADIPETVEAVKKAIIMLFSGQKEGKKHVKLEVSKAASDAELAAAPKISVKTDQPVIRAAQAGDIANSCLGAITAVSGYVLGLCYTAQTLMEIDQVREFAGKFLSPLVGRHGLVAPIFGIINTAGAITRFGVSALRLYQAQNADRTQGLTYSSEETSRIRAECKQELLGLAKTVLKVTLLVFTGYLSLVVQGIATLSVLALDIYLTRKSTKAQTMQTVPLVQPSQWFRVSDEAYEALRSFVSGTTAPQPA